MANALQGKDIRKTSEDEDVASIVDYYIQVGILKKPKDYVMGTPITTDWYSGQTDKERERIWKDAGDAWWKAYGIRNFDELYTEEISQLPEGTRDVNGYYMDKVYEKLKGFDKKMMNDISKKYKKKQSAKRKKNKLPKNRMKMPDSGILNNRYKAGSGRMNAKNNITEMLRETKLQPTAPLWVESDDVWGGFIRIEYDLQSGTTTEGVEEMIKVLQMEVMGWQYILKHEEFYWEDGAWENKFDKE